MGKHEPSIFDEVDEEAEAAADARAEADVAAGRVISNEAMTRWFKTWGKPGRPPPPQCGE